VLHELGIDQAPDLVVVPLDHAHPQPHTDLRRRKAGTRRIEHRLHEVVDETLDRRIDARDLLRLLAKRGVLKSEDGTDHEIDFTRDPLKPNLAKASPPGYASQRESLIRSLDRRRSSSLDPSGPGGARARGRLLSTSPANGTRRAADE